VDENDRRGVFTTSLVCLDISDVAVPFPTRDDNVASESERHVMERSRTILVDLPKLLLPLVKNMLPLAFNLE
jgi:hypothetical protein